MVGRRWIKVLRVGDDQAMIVRSQVGLQAMTDRLNTISTKYGMKINIKKIYFYRLYKQSNIYIDIYYFAYLYR